MEYVLVFMVCAVAVGYLLFSRGKNKPAQDTYICDVCGEKDCLCHKVETKK